MLSAQILIIIGYPLSSASALRTLESASKNAVRPACLRFALPSTLEHRLNGAAEGALFFDAYSGAGELVSSLSTETHFLLLSGAHEFAPHWDQNLCMLWRRQDRRSLLTGSIAPAIPEQDTAAHKSSPAASRLLKLRSVLPAARKEADQRAKSASEGILQGRSKPPARAAALAQICLPALKEVQNNDLVAIGRGLAIVNASEPVRTMVIDPAFLFGPVHFLQSADSLAAEDLSLSAYLSGYSIYALHQAWLWPEKEPPLRSLRLPPADTPPGTTLSRFEQLLGFHDGQRQCHAKAAMGLFGHEDTYPQHMPASLALRSKTRSACMKLLDFHMPLMVSAFIDLPDPRVASAFYLLRFGFLRRLHALPLVLYTGGSQERALRSAFPHTQSYPDNALLPRQLLHTGMKAEEHFARSKMLLVQRAAKRQVEFTHAAWVDMDILPHPICPETVPDFTPFMDDRIHLATVNGVPDGSFVVVPTERLETLVRMVQSITQLDNELKRGFSEPLLWERIFQQKPQWFAIHPMPRRRLLFLSVFDHELLSQANRSRLANLSEPYYASQADAPTKARSEKESSADA